MSKGQTTAQTLDVATVRTRLDGLVDDVSREQTRFLVEKNGVAVAALVSAEDLERLLRLDREREERRALLSRLREPFKELSHERIESDVADLVAEVRAEMATEQEAVSSER